MILDTKSPGPITENHFWLLDIAALWHVRLDLLCLSPKDLGLQWNRRPPRMSRVEFSQILAELIDAGLLEAFSADDEPVSANAILEAIDTNSAKQQGRFNVALSVAGASIWEAIAEPDWTKFYDEYPVPNDDGVCNSTGMNRSAFACMSEDRLREVIFMLMECSGMTLRMRSPVRNEQPWEATYWKQFQTGVSAEFDWLSSFGRGIDDDQLRFLVETGKRSKSDRCRVWSRWCKRGFSVHSCHELIDI